MSSGEAQAQVVDLTLVDDSDDDNNNSNLCELRSALEEPEPTPAKRLFQQPPLIVEVQNTGDSATDSNMENNLTIRIAFLGNVSVGKSTLLNVVLGERYNPTSMKRTTSGVREFHLVPQFLSRKRKAQEFASFQASASSGAAGENGDQDHVRIIRDQIHQDNEAQRELQTMDDPMVFPIETQRGFLGEQRDDVTLAFVDVPGLNETKKEVYCHWVENNWNDFDCAVVVLDATQDCQTQDVACLLELVRRCHMQVRPIPVIFVANKVDDINNASLCLMVDHMKEDLTKTFDGVFSIESYQGREFPVATVPAEPKQAAFVAISAQYALLFEQAKMGWSNSCRSKGLADFMKADVDFDLIDQFGLEEVGKNKWKRLATKEEKYKRVYEELQDTELLRARIRDANFKTFQDILMSTFCGKQRQTDLLESQLDYKIGNSVSCDQIYTRLCEIHKMAQLLGREDHVVKFFWKTYKAVEQDSQKKVTDSVDPKPLATLAFLMHMYFKFLIESNLPGRDKEVEKLQETFEELVHLQVELVLKKLYSNWREPPMRNNPPPGCHDWDLMTPDLWADIFDSMLLAGDGPGFKNTFGKDVIAITRALRTVCNHTSNTVCMKPADLVIPREFSDDRHWGHLIHSYCDFTEKLNSCATETAA
ncbi:hypothetical protein ACA910_004232 [Epithemia clementina (nom. ined.)]